MIRKAVTRRSAVRTSVLDVADALRLEANRSIADETRSELGQFMTPPDVARFMASLFRFGERRIRLLDPGAAVGMLTAAFVEAACAHRDPPESIEVAAFELDPMLVVQLEKVLAACRARCEETGVRFSSSVVVGDFIETMVNRIEAGMFGSELPSFTHVIMNPPYRKIRTDSDARRLLARVGIETSNLYTAFMSLASMSMGEGGEFVSITPRSFCNGTYFRPFRHAFLSTMCLSRIHVFESRKVAFREDDVLQENIITYAVRSAGSPQSVLITTSDTPAAPVSTKRIVPFEQVVRPSDPDAFIHLVVDEDNARLASQMMSLSAGLPDLGLQVSTGRVVDFRAPDHLRLEPGTDTVPLIYPCNLCDGRVVWPREGQRKPKAICGNVATQDLLVETGFYVLVKRFSAKEERRRVVAAVFDPNDCPTQMVGFENHLNYFHARGTGMPAALARGLAVFLNSTAVDTYFRQFNGHTQVNASDLKKLHYPARSVLERVGRASEGMSFDQDAIDTLSRRLFG